MPGVPGRERRRVRQNQIAVPLASRRPRLRLILAALAAGLALAAAPSGASAAPTPGCTQTNSPAPGEPSEWTCHFDPITIGPYEVRESIAAISPQVHAPPVSGHITDMEVDVVDANGVPIPINRLMLHHIVFLNVNAQGDATCNRFVSFANRLLPFRGYAPERFYAAGEERAEMHFPEGYGYMHTGASATWGLVYMLMNHRPKTDTGYIQYKLTIDPDPAIKSARPYWLDVANCRADPIYNVPGTGKRGSTHRRSRSFVVHENGYVVGGLGHVHGGARKLTITQPACGNRRLAQSVPTWGLPGHPFYKVRPKLHEPGPINMSAFRTETGIPVRKGQRLRLNSLYDNSLPHTRVMGIFVVYIAPDDSAPSCGPLPGDIEILKTSEPGRKGPIRYPLPLTGLRNGRAVTIKAPRGKLKRLRSGAVIRVGDRFFSRRRVLVRRGARLRWRFRSRELHNLTLASGPVGIGSPNLNGGRIFSFKFRRPGRYKFFCALHPVQMTELVLVKRPRKGKRRRRNR